MKDELFVQLIKESESFEIDFKSKEYSLSNDVERAKFVKDILAFANTRREGNAYIVLGVKDSHVGGKELLGLSVGHDDAMLQDQLVKWAEPIPRFSYETVVYEGKTFGIISIPIQKNRGPFLSRRTIGNILVDGKIYYRRSSKNETATESDMREIYKWFCEDIDADEVETAMVKSPAHVLEDSLDGFDSARYDYLLFLPKGSLVGNGEGCGVGGVDWSAVVDFDCNSRDAGVLGASRGDLERRRGVHLLTKGDVISVSHAGTYWYFASGLSGRADTLSNGGYKEWQRTHGRDLDDFLCILAMKLQNPVKIFALWYPGAGWDGDHYLRYAVERSDVAFGDRCRVVVVGGTRDRYQDALGGYDALCLGMSEEQVSGVLRSALFRPIEQDAPKMMLPTDSGAHIDVDVKDAALLSEAFFVVYHGMSLDVVGNYEDRLAFFKGGKITWEDVALHVDVERDLYSQLRSGIEKSLRQRRCIRINLYHEPGSGGSTLARRVLWDFSQNYPSLLLEEANTKLAIEYLEKIYSLTRLPSLLVVEMSVLNQQQADELEAGIRARNVPVTILQVQRKVARPSNISPSSYYLEGGLTGGEVCRFGLAYKRAIPSKAGVIERIPRSVPADTISPFFYSLSVFEEEFISLEQFVYSYIEGIEGEVRTIFLYIAMAYYYGHQALSFQFFSKMLGLPMHRRIRLQSFVVRSVQRIFAEEDRDVWRPCHYLVAQELVRQLSTPPRGGARDNWKHFISRCFEEFIEYFAEVGGREVTTSVSNLMQRMFILREEGNRFTDGFDERDFARTICDIPTDEGKLAVFLKLVECFPYDHHYWLHLGRFYASRQRYDEAISSIDRALAINGMDPLVYHVKGMAFGKWVASLIRQAGKPDDIVSLAESASVCFSTARNMAPYDEYNYISEAQVLIRVVEYCSAVAGVTPVNWSIKASSAFFRVVFDHVESLLRDLQRRRNANQGSSYELNCIARLKALYGNHSEALQVWQNAIDNRNVYAPPIKRQIIRALLRRFGDSWRRLPVKDLRRCIRLSEELIVEEPENSHNMLIWIQSIRYLEAPFDVDRAHERVAQWQAVTQDLDAFFYRYVLYAVSAIHGSVIDRLKCLSALEECRSRSRNRRDRTKSLEWVGIEEGISCLVRHSSLGDWNNSADFWEDASRLRRIEGTIARINGPESGIIDVCGLKAFFVPGKSGHRAGIDENTRVSFHLGFSYDGLRAWSVLSV